MHRRITRGLVAAVILILSGRAVAATPLLFDKSEFAARRAKLMDRIPDGAAILLGAWPALGYG